MDILELKNRKKALKLTTQQLAYLADLPVGTVSKIMTGETKNPSYVTVEKLDKALMREEMIRRIEAYKNALYKYYQDNEQSGITRKEFDKMYRDENGLDDAPIPFAKKKSSNNFVEGNIVKKTDYRLTTDVINTLGEDRYIELINGEIIIGQAPNLDHQIMVQNIGKAIDSYIENKRGKCRVFSVSINVFLDEDEYTMLIPDIAVICDDSKLNEKGILGAPDLVIEVVSESTRHMDYNEKMHKYMCSGTREYWIVDAKKERITVYLEGEPMMAYVYGLNDEIPVGIYDGDLTICGENMRD